MFLKKKGSSFSKKSLRKTSALKLFAPLALKHVYFYSPLWHFKHTKQQELFLQRALSFKESARGRPLKPLPDAYFEFLKNSTGFSYSDKLLELERNEKVLRSFLKDNPLELLLPFALLVLKKDSLQDASHPKNASQGTVKNPLSKAAHANFLFDETSGKFHKGIFAFAYAPFRKELKALCKENFNEKDWSLVAFDLSFSHPSSSLQEICWEIASYYFEEVASASSKVVLKAPKLLSQSFPNASFAPFKKGTTLEEIETALVIWDLSQVNTPLADFSTALVDAEKILA